MLLWSDQYGKGFSCILCPLKIKPNRCTNFSNLFWNKNLHVSDSSSVHHQEFFTVHIHAAMVCHRDLLTACSQAVSKPVWHIPLLCVQWKPPDDGQRNCPKHLQFYSKNKFEKLVHLFGLILRVCHYARSPERQICFLYVRGMAFSSKQKSAASLCVSSNALLSRTWESRVHFLTTLMCPSHRFFHLESARHLKPGKGEVC